MEVSPGAVDYPYSDFIGTTGQNRSVAIAGDRTLFYLQAKGSSGNDKITAEDAQGDLQSPDEKFMVDIIGSRSSKILKDPRTVRQRFSIIKNPRSSHNHVVVLGGVCSLAQLWCQVILLKYPIGRHKHRRRMRLVMAWN